MDKNDLISRGAAMEIVKRTSGDYAAAWAEIERLPAIDPEDLRPKAHWYDIGSLSCRCSACGCKNNRESRYCPMCGAKMEE